ncbi:hypothetical protein IscW_ISCW023142 [Ixodes scapularis]|uniref:Uncharacterized protein n=1 Tax=Ixodes scapularis TaxID=6945 RepID=B7QGX6_IXOSC|nr:hypothetical protein IscW_ISCW023142 [Ixodes scapularis]|eukprot:XP_002414433.1 hypothetical protein IscW_ISCW023142 [Ixodes scapularis]
MYSPVYGHCSRRRHGIDFSLPRSSGKWRHVAACSGIPSSSRRRQRSVRLRACLHAVLRGLFTSRVWLGSAVAQSPSDAATQARTESLIRSARLSQRSHPALPDMPSGWSELALQCVSRGALLATRTVRRDAEADDNTGAVRDGFLTLEESKPSVAPSWLPLFAWVAHVRDRSLARAAATLAACLLEGGICSVTDGMENLRAQNPTVSPASIRIKNMPR